MRGVTLIELMVGMAIGLLATLVITQVALVYEGQKRTTTSGSDAQVNGALALQALQRDVQSSGYGLASGGLGGCSEIRGRRVGMTDVKKWDMTPVKIVDGIGGAGAPDEVRVLMSSQTGFALPIRVSDQHTLGDTQFRIADKTNVGNQQGDLMLVVPPAGSTNTYCSLFSISEIPPAAGGVPDRIIKHAAGAAAGQEWNQDPTPGTTVFPGNISTDVSYRDGSHLVNLGTRLIDRTYRLDTVRHVLMMDTFDSSVATTDPLKPTSSEELFPNIASLQAVYGLDTNNDRQVDDWQPVVPKKLVGATNVPAWEQVFALRIAVVVRSAQPEKEKVTPDYPVWHPDGIKTEKIPVNDISKTDPEAWMHYRYKVFETVVPLRNMVWQ